MRRILLFLSLLLCLLAHGVPARASHAPHHLPSKGGCIDASSLDAPVDLGFTLAFAPADVLHG